MTAIASAAADAAHPLDDETRAAALWTFVHLKTPRFASAEALDVVRELAVQPGEDVKALAKRLRAALARRGVSLKHTHALEAASKLTGFKGWHVGGSKVAKKPLALESSMRLGSIGTFVIGRRPLTSSPTTSSEWSKPGA